MINVIGWSPYQPIRWYHAVHLHEPFRRFEHYAKKGHVIFELK